MGMGGGGSTSSASISPESTIGVTPISVNNSSVLRDVKGQGIDGTYGDVIMQQQQQNHQAGNVMGQTFEDTEMMDSMTPQQPQQQQQASQKTL